MALSAGDATYREAAAGRGRLVLLGGEAGVGKTSLAQVMADRAAAQGAVVRFGASWEGGGIALGAWTDVLRRPGGDECAEVAEHLADGALDPAGPDAAATERARLRLITTVIDALRAATARAPQVIVLDDLQWADATSVLLLQVLTSQLPALRAMVIGTYRDDEVPPDSFLHRVGGTIDRQLLQGLAPADSAHLLGEALGRPPTDDEVAAVHRQTGGNPLFVTHVGRLLAAGGPLRVPGGVGDVLTRRLARLPSTADAVLGAASVLGLEFDPALVAALAGRTGADVASALDAATRARLATPVEDRPGRWAFSHALVRATRYEALSTLERTALHRRALDLLQERGTPAETLAHHAIRAGLPAEDPRPAELSLAAAGDVAARLAVEDTVRLTQQALDRAPVGPTGDGLRARAWLGLGAARLRLGDEDGAGDAFEACAALGRQLGDANVLAHAALGFGAGLGGFEVRMLDPRQADLLEEAAAALEETSELRPWVLARLSIAMAFAGEEARRLALADEAVRLARARGDLRAVGAALASRCDAIAGPDHTTERLGAATEIVAVARQATDLGLELLGRRFRLVALAELCEIDALDAEIEAFERGARRLGDPLYTWYVPLWRGMRALSQGRLADCAALLAEAEELGARAGSANAAVLTEVLRFYAAHSAGDRAGVSASLTAIGGKLPLLLVNGQPMTVYVDNLVSRPGAASAAHEVVAGADRLVRDAEWVAALAPLADLAFHYDLADGATRLYELLAPYSGLGVLEGIGATHRGATDLFLAKLAAVNGDATAVARHVDRALEIAGRIGVLLLAEAQSEAALALTRLGDPAQAGRAADLAAAATTTFTRLGLTARTGGRSHLEPEPGPAAASGAGAAPGAAVLAREGDSWAVTWKGTTVRIRHAKGVADLAVLLARPGREVHVRELEGVAGVVPGVGGAAAGGRQGGGSLPAAPGRPGGGPGRGRPPRRRWAERRSWPPSGTPSSPS